MWFFFGIISLTLSIYAFLKLRRRYRFVGERETVYLNVPQPLTLVYVQTQQLKHKNKNIGFKFGISCASALSFAIHRETFLDRWGKKIGVTREHSLGSAKLDKELFLDCNDQRVAWFFQSSGEARDVLQQLFNSLPNKAELVLFENTLWVDVREAADLPQGDQRVQLAHQLFVLGQWLLTYLAGHGAQKDYFVWRASIVLAISMGSLVFGLIALIRLANAPQVLNQSGLFSLAAGIGVLLWLLLVFMSWRFVHGSARAHRVLLEVVIVGLVGCVMSTQALLREANTDFDSKPNRVERFENARAYEETYRCGKRKRRTCYRYWLSLPDQRLRLNKLKLSQQSYWALRDHSTIDVSIKPGWAGFAWVQSITAPSDVRQAERSP